MQLIFIFLLPYLHLLPNVFPLSRVSCPVFCILCFIYCAFTPVILPCSLLSFSDMLLYWFYPHLTPVCVNPGIGHLSLKRKGALSVAENGGSLRRSCEFGSDMLWPPPLESDGRSKQFHLSQSLCSLWKCLNQGFILVRISVALGSQHTFMILILGQSQTEECA